MANIIFYRNKCIGCGICFEMQPALWRLSKKDGKASLLKSIPKKDLFVLPAGNPVLPLAKEVALACPVKIIKIV